MERYLREAGIETPAQLKETGPFEAYLRIRAINPRVMNRMALYALYGALTNQNCLYLPQETKDWLNAELEKYLTQDDSPA
ncbi:MAG: TfoX/Sxy family DNA transformation protein [Rickettsiales bacterium]|nr:TfoX/Sxy family DNA transformation protein [Rickettsiales bacterium]